MVAQASESLLTCLVQSSPRYRVASGARQDVGFNDDYASKGHEYFDVWAPEIATHYGTSGIRFEEVFLPLQQL